MEAWAAIDLYKGRVVTLVQGRPGERTVWDGDPVSIAKRWEGEGADGLHIVDLDAAFEEGSNLDLVREVIGAVRIPVQVGGGVRTREDVERRLGMGASRVVVGTLAYREPETLARILESHPEKVVVAADYRDGVVVTRAWTNSEGMPLMQAVKRLEQLGVRRVLATSVKNDGMASGPDVQMMRVVCANTKMEVLSSGGIRNVEDAVELARAGSRGVILGRALYDGGIRISEMRARGV